MLDYNKNLGTKQKALYINLDKRIYGSFAEIGAGQDVQQIFSRQVAQQVQLPKQYRHMIWRFLTLSMAKSHRVDMWLNTDLQKC